MGFLWQETAVVSTWCSFGFWLLGTTNKVFANALYGCLAAIGDAGDGQAPLMMVIVLVMTPLMMVRVMMMMVLMMLRAMRLLMAMIMVTVVLIRPICGTSEPL